jgi:DNA helicase-2/ATP-dependent DNA helicase PcrA
LDYDRDLNPQQLAVVKATGGPLLVIAGAGSGKTRVVTYRVAYLIESGVDPSKVLLLTFTNKAAREMLHRVEMLVPTRGGAGGGVWGGTFHHIGNRILRRHALLVGYQPNYSILDREDSKKLMNSCLSDLKIHPGTSRFPKGEVVESLWGLAVNTRKPVEEIVLERYPYFHGFMDDIQAVIERYRRRKRELNAMDFDDLLFQWEALLRGHPEVRQRYHDQFQHILVDEYQDTNRLQADVLDLLAQKHRNLMVVGDDSQSIYSFRGANFANILTFPERYPGAKIFKLEINYRSTPEILHLANTSIIHNRRQFPKELQTIRPAGSRPFLVPVQGIMEQAAFVAQKLEEINQRGVPLAHMAVLYRAHYHSMELQMELSRRRIPYDIRSGLRFFEQAHIKDVSAYLKIISNPLDELAWKRVLPLYPKIGKSTAHKVWQMVLSGSLNPQTSMETPEALQKIPARVRENWRSFCRTLSILRDLEKASGPGAMIERILREGYEAYLQSKYPDPDFRMDDLQQLAAFAYRYSSCEDFLSELALLTSPEEDSVPLREGDENGTVTLSSVHQAKGLEWTVVFIIGLADGRFPSVRSLMESGGEGEEEERRLFYVAITRARDELFLCYPRFAPDRGRREMIQRPSRFLAELSRMGYERLAPPEEDG